MKRHTFLAACLFVAACLTLFGKTLGSARDGKAQRLASDPVSAAKRVVVHAAGRGNPYINFEDGVELPASYEGAPEMQNLLKQNAAEPRALASADFDEDGVPDLICGYARPGGGIITLHRGNVDSIYQNSPEAQRRKAEGHFTDSAFLSPARVFEASIAADFVGAGDFDADGHWDVVIAARGVKELSLLPGDGKGGFLSARRVALPGAVTSLITGEINRADGLTDVVAGVAADDGPKVLVFEGPEGALRASPEIFSLPGEPRALALGQFDNEYTMDLAVGAGSELVIIHGRDRKLSLDDTRKTEVLPARIDNRAFGFEIRSIAAGDFSGTNETSLAVLGANGTVHLIGAQKQVSDKKAAKKKGGDAADAEVFGQWRGATQLVCGRVSTGPADDLVILNKDGHSLQIQKTGLAALSRSARSSSVRVSTLLDLDGELLAVQAMRLNGDALGDLVVLQGGGRAPAILKTTAPQTFTVNKADDHDDGFCDSGDCTLREAINTANANAGADTIGFNIPGAGVHTIMPSSALPTITDPVTIDGTTEPGYSGTPLIALNGIQAGNNASGLFITSGNSTVKGLTFNFFSFADIHLNTGGNNIVAASVFGDAVTNPGGWNSDSGVAALDSSNNLIGGTTAPARNIVLNNLHGVLIQRTNPNATAIGNLIQGNLIGTDDNGTIEIGNRVSGVDLAAFNNTVGGLVAGARNLISGNPNMGVIVRGSGNLVQGNFIGTDASGAASLKNGVGIELTGPNNLIGGTTPPARNIISGNVLGLWVVTFSDGSQVQGNFIGTDLTGTAIVGNTSGGISVQASNVVIGGVTDGAGNLISGNTSGGIEVRDFRDSPGNIVQGNLIGTDGTGNVALGGQSVGVGVFSENSLIGGTDSRARNVISGNNIGIAIGGLGSPRSLSSTVQGNWIGKNASGNGAVPNTFAGMIISDTYDNLIGGLEPGAGNTIQFNGRVGVLISGNTHGNSLRRNSISSNGGLGIDITLFPFSAEPDGVTSNDPCDADTGPNNVQNSPVLTAAASTGLSTTVHGTLNSTVNTTFTIEFFANAACDPSGNGEGQTFIGSTIVTTSTDCGATFNITLSVGVPLGQFITATATDQAGNTSEFSQCVQVQQGPVFDLCLQDESNGNILLVNSTTGEYQFNNCRGTTLTGIGSLSRKGCLVTLQVNGPDRRILARIDTCSKTGNASIQLLSQGSSFSILDRNTANNTCACAGPG